MAGGRVGVGVCLPGRPFLGGGAQGNNGGNEGLEGQREGESLPGIS